MKKNWIAILLLLSVITSFAQETDITKLDKNFVQATIGKNPVIYRNALEEPFELTGFPFRKPGEPLFRLPSDSKPETISRGVYSLSRHTSGGVIRFRTNSPCLYLISDPPSTASMGHMPSTGVAGYDFYIRTKDGKWSFLQNVHSNGFIPEKGVIISGSREMRDYMICLPLYSGVGKIKIGTHPDAKFEKPTPQKISGNVVFYGSSITQGGCASRPGNNYTAMLTRALDAPQVNLGFSGNAKGEPAMAELINRIDMSLFVYDYDYNAPSAEHLKKTHEAFFKMIRAAHPKLPIIILSRCSHYSDARRDVVKKTWSNAVKAGDTKVWFIDGATLFGEPGREFCTVDGCHPNDLGFYMMYKNILPVAKQALGIR